MLGQRCRAPEEILPRGWTDRVKSAVVTTISLAHYAIAQARGKAARSANPRLRRATKIERLRAEIAMLREELRIKDARLAQLLPQRRPHYRPVERMAILELRAARGWSLARTAKRFLVTPATISAGQRRIDEDGPTALIQLSRPVNKFPELVGYLVQRLKTLCPAIGKAQIATLLAQTGLHLGTTTVGRMLKRKTRTPPFAAVVQPELPRVVSAAQPNHVWHVDLTCAPIGGGFWCAWLPGALTQRWPFCWWLAVVIDHCSRNALGVAMFDKQPTSEQVRAFLGRTVHGVSAAPKHLICDRGVQFDCRGFRKWCRRHKIQVRYGAIGKQGSIAIVERFIRTLKETCTRRLPLVPLQRESFRREVALFVGWYNEFRPHSALGGKTPDEVYQRRFPAHRKPRYEPRSHWPRGSPCAKPWALVRGSPGAKLELHVAFHGGRKHLPIVTLKRVA
jgi:putative transposase